MDGRASYTPVSHFSISYHLVVLIFLPIPPPDLTLDFHFPQKTKPIAPLSSLDSIRPNNTLLHKQRFVECSPPYSHTLERTPARSLTHAYTRA